MADSIFTQMGSVIKNSIDAVGTDVNTLETEIDAARNGEVDLNTRLTSIEEASSKTDSLDFNLFFMGGQ